MATYDSDGAFCKFRNHYECYRCEHKWTDRWSSMCDDDCPKCGARHCTPTHSDDVEE
jgi:predicted  nucleic acid-binding Zn-ribbon protein